MILIWKGLGFLVPVFWIGAIFTGDRLADLLFGPDASPAVHNITVQWLAAFLTLALAIYIRSLKKVWTHWKTGDQVVVRPVHTFFFLPVWFWSLVFFALGAYLYLR